MTMTRRAFAALPLLGIPPAAWACVVEPGWLEFTERVCPIPHLTRPVDIVHLSDLHASVEVPVSLIERSVDMAVSAKPDIICVTGDFVTVATGFDRRWYEKTLSKLAAARPTYAVLGNHDGGKWSGYGGGLRGPGEVTRMLEASGVEVLSNRSVKISPQGSPLRLVGVHDVWSGFMDAPKAFSEVGDGEGVVLLSHNPDSKKPLGKYPWNVMLSGHTHGGQVVMPITGTNPAPVADRRYVEGLKPWRDRWIHVSRGVGSIKGVRFNCRPEVTLLRLACADG